VAVEPTVEAAAAALPGDELVVAASYSIFRRLGIRS
jgi:hypothetical protein